MAASFNGHVDIVRILIKAKAQINIQEEVYTNVCIRKHTASNIIDLYSIRYVSESR